MNRDLELSAVLGDYQGWLRKVATSLLSAASPDLDDLVQEGYIAMWRALGTYQGSRGALPAWLTYKARFRMLEVVQRRHWTGQARRSFVPNELVLSLDGEVLAESIGMSSSVLEAAELAYHHGEIVAAIDALPEAQRRYVIARFWGGLSASQMVEYGVFGYDATSLWTSKVNGARGKLRESLAHLA